MRSVLLIVALAALVTAPAARAADRVIAQVPEVVPLAAHGSTLAYSRQDETGRWRLVVWAGGVARDVPVASREKPFDVDLGHHPGGAVAVYSRCEQRRSCDLFRADLATGRERRLARVSSATRDETRPALHGSRVIFERSGDLWSGGIDDSGGAVRRISTAVPNGWDLLGGRLVATTGGFQPGKERSDVYLRLQRPFDGRRGAVLHHASSGLLSSVRFSRPTLTRRHAFTAQVRYASSGQRFVRVDVRTGERTEATGRAGMQAAVPLGARVAYIWSRSGIENTCSNPEGPPAACEIRLTPPLTYR